jgi:hypothetical protein
VVDHSKDLVQIVYLQYVTAEIKPAVEAVLLIQIPQCVMLEGIVLVSVVAQVSMDVLIHSKLTVTVVNYLYKR